MKNYRDFRSLQQLSPTVLLSSKWKVDSLRLTVTVDFDLSWLPVLTQHKEALLYIVNYKNRYFKARKSQPLTSWDELTGNKLKWPRRMKYAFVCLFTNKNIFLCCFLVPAYITVTAQLMSSPSILVKFTVWRPNSLVQQLFFCYICGCGRNWFVSCFAICKTSRERWFKIRT